MIISRTPYRISFAGGGSDMREFYMHHGGAVVSVAIRKYIYLSMHPFFEERKNLLKYSELELVDSVEQIRHRIIRTVFRQFKIQGVDFSSSADVPSGTGLGSSSAFTVGLINLCNAYSNRFMHPLRIAEHACEVEIEDLQQPIGKQDQYATALGGLNYLKFCPDGQMQIEPLKLSEDTRLSLQNNLRMYFLGTTRAASSVLTEQRQNISSDAAKIANLKKMVRLADALKDSLCSGQIDGLGEIMHTGWMYKKELARNISNERIEHFYNLGLRNGATGGKLLGAGGGGFLLFYVPESEQKRLRQALDALTEYKVEFDTAGTSIIYNDARESRSQRQSEVA